MNTEFLFGMTKKFWKCIVVMVAQHHDCTSCREIVHLKMAKMVSLCYVYFTTIKKKSQKVCSINKSHCT